MKKTGCFLNCSYLSFLNCCCFLNCPAGVTKKLKKVIYFTFLPVTLQKNTWKNQIHEILYFHVEKWGSQAGKWQPRTIPTLGFASGRKESRLPFACFWPPFSNLKIQNNCSFGFSNCFSQPLLENSETKYYSLIFPIFSSLLYPWVEPGACYPGTPAGWGWPREVIFEEYLSDGFGE